MKVYLERIDHQAGMARFYAVMVTPTLFGDWAVVREWGRIGQGGTVRDSVHDSESEAQSVAADIVRGKVRKGYEYRCYRDGMSAARGAGAVVGAELPS